MPTLLRWAVAVAVGSKLPTLQFKKVSSNFFIFPILGLII
jgi:hypothetical protein